MDRAIRFDNGVAPAVMRTEGVIKIGSMMEERIFDFDRQCGSHARGVPRCVCICVRRLLYPYSPNVIGWLLDASNPRFSLSPAPPNPSLEPCIPLLSNERPAACFPPCLLFSGGFLFVFTSSGFVQCTEHGIMPDMSLGTILPLLGTPTCHICPPFTMLRFCSRGGGLAIA